MLPNFLVIGAMKAGTTSLYEYLRHHPQVFMPETKELDFFLERSNWHRGLEWYETQFQAAGGQVAVGEASPNYSKRHDDPGVADRIAATLPGTRLIYIVRHPIARMRSMYRQLVADGIEHRPIEEAFASDPDYVLTSRYAWQLEPFLELLPRDRILVITTEALRDNRETTVARVFDFLGVDSAWSPPRIEREAQRGDQLRVPRRGLQPLGRLPGYQDLLNRSWRLRALHRRITTRAAPKVETTLSPETEASLARTFAQDVAELYQLVDGD
ncbi:MAG TPA: sulfotransferase, partial [Acidimicrobiia bacterium]|nr:sulfotransferase [Acidimicrobiia bacterium]